MVKNLLAMQKTQKMWFHIWVWEDPLEESMATHSCIPAWRIPWTEGLAGYHPWSCKKLDKTEATEQSNRNKSSHHTGNPHLSHSIFCYCIHLRCFCTLDFYAVYTHCLNLFNTELVIFRSPSCALD